MTLYDQVLAAVQTVPGVTIHSAVNSKGSYSIRHLIPAQQYAHLGEIVITFQTQRRIFSKERALASMDSVAAHLQEAGLSKLHQYVGFMLVYEQDAERVYITTIPLHLRLIEDSNRQTLP